MLAPLLEGDDTAAAAAQQFEGDAPRTAEEVQRRQPLEVEVLLQDVEEILLSEVCRGTSVEALRDVEAAPLLLPAYDAHSR